MATTDPGSDRPKPSSEPSGEVPWWRRGVVYQVYVRSFADGNGDGTGDIAGLRSRLGYLQDLGVDAIWINPWYRSPLADGGYDVADYRQIEPRYGDVDQAARLIAEAHDHGIRVIADLVPNHTSEEHEWFAEALNAPEGDPKRGRYHFRAGQGDGPPNDWRSVFGGPAWSRAADHRLSTNPDDEQWYLHLFAPEQPDLNWEHDEVREELLAVLRFWLDRGVDGFRIDVAHGLVKDPAFPDLGGDATSEVLASSKRADHPFWDRDGIHEIVRQWRAVLDDYDDRMMVAEAWVRPDRLPLYLRPDEYHQSFNFDLLEAPWDATAMGGIIAEASAAAATVGSTPTWVLSNHDVMREATRYGLPNGTEWRVWPTIGPVDLLDVDLGARRARAAALLLLGLPGSAYVYQGEELGLPEVWDLPEAVLDDPVWTRSGGTHKGRDGCRVPVPWTESGPSYGFGDGAAWLPQPPTWAGLSAEAQASEPTSTLSLYRQVIDLRRQHGTADEELQLVSEEFASSGAEADVLAYRRGSGLTCVVNFGAPIELPAGMTELVRSTGEAGQPLGTDEAVWLLPTE